MPRPPDEAPRSEDASSLPFSALLLPPVLVGAFLRLYRVREQCLTGDELHLLNAVSERSIAELASEWTRFGADYSVPLGLFFRALSNAGVALSEMVLRAPMLASSIALLFLLPLWIERSFGRRAAIALAWALACSPLLVVYGRMVRSYGPVVLLISIALMAFHRFLRNGGLGAAAGYAISAALAAYVHLASAPLAFAPLVYGAARRAMAKPSRTDDAVSDASSWASPPAFGWPALVATGMAALALFALFLWPALQSLLDMRQVHGRGAPPGLGAWWEVVRLHSGTRWWPLTLIVLGVLGRGVVEGIRRDSELTWLVLSCLVVQIAGLIVLGPDQLDNPIVIGRYLLGVLPFGLAFVALGATSPFELERIGRIEGARAWVPGALLLGLVFASGPLATREFRTSSFLHASTFVRFTERGNRVDRGALPQGYEWILATGRREAIVEYPWSNVASHAFDAYQKHHELPVLFGGYGDAFASPRVAARNTVVGQPRPIVESRAGFLVVHLDLKEEESRVLTNDPHHWRRLRDVEGIWRPLLHFGPRMDRHLRTEFGPPDFEDGRASVWDLERVRSRIGEHGSSDAH